MGNERIDMVSYVELENDLQRQLFQSSQVSHQPNINISTSKSKCMTIAKELLRRKLVVEDKPMEQVMQFRYLGTQLKI